MTIALVIIGYLVVGTVLARLGYVLSPRFGADRVERETLAAALLIGWPLALPLIGVLCPLYWLATRPSRKDRAEFQQIERCIAELTKGHG